MSADAGWIGGVGFLNGRTRIGFMDTEEFQFESFDRTYLTVQAPALSADGKYRAYLRSGNVYVSDREELGLDNLQVSVTGSCSDVAISGDGCVIAWTYDGQIYAAHNPYLP